MPFSNIRKYHHTVLEVSFDALKFNLDLLRATLLPSTKLMMMIKANAYGIGSLALAKFLEHEPVDYLAVAYTDEGIELRKAGVKLPIMVLNPHPSNFDVIESYALEPTIASFESLAEYQYFSCNREALMPIHIKLDTGMHRLGFEEADLESLITELLKMKHLKVKSIYSHLAGAEDATFDDYSQQQIALFYQLYHKLKTELKCEPLRHILNSAGVMRLNEAQMDMVRIGIAWYGGMNMPSLNKQFKPVLKLKTTISQVRSLSPSETIGYNRKGVLRRKSKVAAINIGYADGFLRALGNGNYKVKIGDQLVPTLGNVCMDITMVDVTELPDVQVGDEVVIFGDDPTAMDMAKALNTISYEVFTNVDRRVKRVYVDQD